MRKLFILAVLLLALTPLIFADQLGEQLSRFGALLDANISITNNELMASPQIVFVTITAHNQYSTTMPIYVIRNQGYGWEVVKLVGSLPPNSYAPIELDVEVNYRKITGRNTQYAVVARGGDGQLYGKYFSIIEDWGAYETGIQDGINSTAMTIVPIIGILLIALVFIVFKVAYESKSPGLDSTEFTMKSIVFPETEGRPFEEKVADLVVHPLILIVELGCAAILVLMMHQTLVQASGPENVDQLVAIAGVGSFFVPFLYFAAAWYFEKREELKPLRFFAGIFIWGMFAAFCSLLVSSYLVGMLSGSDLLPYAGIIAIMFIAPIVEETMKGLGILGMSGHHEYNDTLTGLLLGFTCGVGFAFMENWFYFSAKTNPFDVGLATWGMLVLYRSFFNSLAHGCFTAAISAPIGYLRSIPSLKRYARLAFVPALFLAISIHILFNTTALADGYAVADREVPFYLFNPMMIILLAAFFFLFIVLATIDEKKRKVAEKHKDIMKHAWS
ncbi:MAG: PrsW family intramembrane metalloprotease [Candidatus Micrarchaeota archaeon]|nr:PrsW family intramembrane metalloprotease [Candidatus Micrarchaeota archaeon]